MFGFCGREIEQPLEHHEDGLLLAHRDLYEIADLQNEAADLMEKHAMLLFNRIADKNGLLLAAEIPFKFFDCLFRFGSKVLEGSAQSGLIPESFAQNHETNAQRIQLCRLLVEVSRAIVNSLPYNRVVIIAVRDLFVSGLKQE